MLSKFSEIHTIPTKCLNLKTKQILNLPFYIPYSFFQHYLSNTCISNFMYQKLTQTTRQQSKWVLYLDWMSALAV